MTDFPDELMAEVAIPIPLEAARIMQDQGWDVRYPTDDSVEYLPFLRVQISLGALRGFDPSQFNKYKE